MLTKQRNILNHTSYISFGATSDLTNQQMGIKNKDTYLANVHAIITNEEKAVQDLNKIKEHVSNTISNDHLNVCICS